MAMTVRLSDQLRKEVGRYSDQEGLTVNALIAVALREFLDRRRVVGGLDRPVAVVSGVGSGGSAPAGGNSLVGAPMALGAAIAKRVQGPPAFRKAKKRRGR